MDISASPSMIVAIASNGAVCSERPSPAPKAKRVMVPLFLYVKKNILKKLSVCYLQQHTHKPRLNKSIQKVSVHIMSGNSV